MGLHTCGALAWDQLALASRGFAVLNIGCCYEKLDAEKDTERSKVAQAASLGWTGEALYLANRGGIERWTDGCKWSQSRMHEPFLLYEEKAEVPKEESEKLSGDKKCAQQLRLGEKYSYSATEATPLPALAAKIGQISLTA